MAPPSGDIWVLRLGCGEASASANHADCRIIRQEADLEAPSLSLGLPGTSEERSVGSSLSYASLKRERSDEDEARSVSKKLRLKKEQSAVLEQRFRQDCTLNPIQKMVLARQLNLRPRQVEVWFQNRRARTKLKQTEVDCELQWACYEMLRDENRRLQRELKELREVNYAMRLRRRAWLLLCAPRARGAAVAVAEAVWRWRGGIAM